MIRIVDAGFTGIATFFPEAVLAQNPLPPNEVIDENKIGRYGLSPDKALGHYEVTPRL